MNDYELMRLSERMEEDAADLRDYELAELTAKKADPKRLREKYKEFYSDIKLSQKEDW